MEKHKCKLCLKSFVNGRALGGHMRSHMLNLYVKPKSPHPPSPLPSPPFSSSSEEEEEDDDGDDSQGDSDDHGLSENPKKCTQLAGGVTVATAGAGAGGDSVVLPDRESETEVAGNVTVRRRSKRIRRSEIRNQPHFLELHRKYMKKSNLVMPESSWMEPEPVSSISDTSPEEDVAYCLMMLSRDTWTEEHQNPDVFSDPDEDSGEILKAKRTPARSKYTCETCNKVFRSYQALGGHRASHKKIKLSHNNNNHQTQNSSSEEKIHECPVCFKVFSSGQALGGHKRSHVTASSSSAMAASKPVPKQSIPLIDLNLPAPVEGDDEFSQIEFSMVSDGEFVKTH